MVKTDLNEVHAEAIKRFGKVQDAVKEERDQCLEDRRFYSIAGAQWEGNLGEQFANKPRFEVNKVHLSVIRIFSEYLNNKVTVDFLPRSEGRDDLADLCDKLFRADEQDSCAQEAYDNAFEEAVGGGFGAWRLRACYEDEEDEENDYQRVRIEPITDADSTVFFDIQSIRQDKADAKYCFVICPMTRDAYIERFGEEPDSSLEKEVSSSEYDWITDDKVNVAEYYRIETKYEMLHYFEAIDGSEEKYWSHELDEEKIYELNSVGTFETRKRRVKRKKCHKYIISGSRVIEDCGYIAGNVIPIVPVYGKRWVVDGVERCMGHVRLAKDPQRLKNMQLSKLGEISALSSVEKPILTPEQIAGFQNMWAEDNIKDYPYLLINPVTGPNGETMQAGPVGYTKPSTIPPAMAALLQITEEDMRDILGSQGQGEDMPSQISGKAVELIQQRLDMQTYIYLSNLSKAMRRCGEIWLDIAKEIYVEEGREMKVVDQDGGRSYKKIMTPSINEMGEVFTANDLTSVKYDVSVDVGPSSSSKRAATVKALTGMMTITQDPETLQVLNAMAMRNMEGEGINDVREHFRKKLVAMGVIEPTEEDLERMQQEAIEAQNQPPDPQSQLAQAMAMEAQAKAMRAQAEVEETLADTEKAKAETMSEIANIDKIRAETAHKNSQAAQNIQGIAGDAIQDVRVFTNQDFGAEG